MQTSKNNHSNNKEQGKKITPKKYEKPGLTKKSRVPNTPAAWGSYQP